MEESIMVLKESRPHLKVLAELAPQLNHATDRYMEELKAIEAELAQLNIGIPVELDAALNGITKHEELDENNDLIRYRLVSNLAYERLGSTWGFSIRDYKGTPKAEDPRDYDWAWTDTTPLLKASRDMRLAAAEHIPALLEQIVETVKGKMEVLKKATAR
jgi:hypothetical protein